MSLLRYCLPILALVAAALPAWGRVGHAYIDAVSLRHGGRSELLVSFRVQNAFDSRLLDILDSGLPIRFTYSLRVVRPRDVLADQLVSAVTLDRTLVKDNLKNRYVVSSGYGADPRDVGSLTEAQEIMTHVDGARLIVPDGAGRSGPLLLKIKAQLQKFRLPFQLHYLFAFVSYWDVDTDWYVLELPRNADALP
ncbi:MAG: DUF4390 domain-containing protein [Deltaproteobacteria bacterium]|nr:DUF4390 domain-containing protein [Deltaproteobacteria bacterium]